jgi:adenosyl cobinamide kinase/adenosyl cobinamide phosphate guanylyltransferase/NaMN:DMB phosphoribosyltransferase
MSWQSGRRVLVLGGIRSGKSELAESLVAEAGSVRYVATATRPEGDPVEDPEWADRIAAHRARRPAEWATEETGDDPSGLAALLADAKPDEAVLVDDLGGWLTALMDTGGDTPGTDALAAAVRDCPAARLVLVSPEVGLSVVPATEAGRRFADALGALNQAVAAGCDAVALVVAGQPAWVKGGDPRGVPVGARSTTTAAEPAQAAAAVAAPAPPPGEATGAISVNMHLPMPDETAANAAADRLAMLDFAGGGLGGLTDVVTFAAATQMRDVPRPWQSVRLLLVHADHEGGAAAGDSPQESARRLAQARAGEGALALLAGAQGVTVESVRCARRAGPVETADAIDPAAVDEALDYGWQLAGSMVDEGADLLVLGACGSGTEAAAVAVISLLTSADLTKLLARVPAPGGRIDDQAWMARCVAVRDALHRVRTRPRTPHDVLAMLGGPDMAVAAGALIGAVARQTPVLVDGPLGVAAALVARDVGAQTRHWLLLPDTGGHPAVAYGAEVLGVTPVLDLKLGLGEGATALAALPVLRSALTLAATTAPHPALGPIPSIVDSPTTELPLVDMDIDTRE